MPANDWLDLGVRSAIVALPLGVLGWCWSRLRRQVAHAERPGSEDAPVGRDR
jgi:hypothetical protein